MPAAPCPPLVTMSRAIRYDATSQPAPARSDHDGKGLAIAGLALGVATLLAATTVVYITILGCLPLALLGLTLSIWGLRRARRWRNNRAAIALAIAGIVVNSLVLLGWMVLMALLLGLFQAQM